MKLEHRSPNKNLAFGFSFHRLVHDDTGGFLAVISESSRQPVKQKSMTMSSGTSQSEVVRAVVANSFHACPPGVPYVCRGIRLLAGRPSARPGRPLGPRRPSVPKLAVCMDDYPVLAAQEHLWVFNQKTPLLFAFGTLLVFPCNCQVAGVTNLKK